MRLHSMTVIGRREIGHALFFHRLRSDRKYTECSQETCEIVVSPQDKAALPQHRADGIRERSLKSSFAEQDSVCVEVLQEPGA